MLKINILLLTFSLFLYSLCSAVNFDNTFKVALPFLPELKPRVNQINIGSYISSHLYYPMFSFGDEGLKSKFLDVEKTHALSTDFKSFRFCLVPNQSFSNGLQIKLSDLKSSLINIHKSSSVLPEILTINEKDNYCIDLVFKNSSFNYFELLTGTNSTLLPSEEENKSYPIGLGPYKISNLSNTELKLIVNSDAKIKKFNKINFKVWSNQNLEEFDDYNHLPNYFTSGKSEATGFKKLMPRF